VHLLEKMKSLQDDLLSTTASTLVIYRGNLNAELLIIGEAPGVEENHQGIPFVGASGKLLNEVLTEACIDLNNIIFINSVFRAPLNKFNQIRTPTDGEIFSYAPYVNKIISELSPKIILALGNTACYSRIGRKGISKMRGNWHGNIMPTYHPSHILHNPNKRHVLFSDIKHVANALETQVK
jgi:DNA polymerase